jgi:hypothetical protein
MADMLHAALLLSTLLPGSWATPYFFTLMASLRPSGEGLETFYSFRDCGGDTTGDHYFGDAA